MRRLPFHCTFLSLVLAVWLLALWTILSITDHFLLHRITSFVYARLSPRANSSHFYLVFRESALAHHLLDGLSGIEIGASAHNPFSLSTLNVDYTQGDTLFRREQTKLTGGYVQVDVVARGDQLPFPNGTWDFVVSANVLEHFYDPVGAVEEWLRVVRPGGYVLMIIPHAERTFDRGRDKTTLEEIIDRHEHPDPPTEDDHRHYSVWVTGDFLALCRHYGWRVAEWRDEDDKVGDGFIVVLQKADDRTRVVENV